MQHQHPQHPQQGFLALYDPNAPLPQHMRAPSNTNSKNHVASIWAPQPQAGDANWPRALEAFAQPARDDVFGSAQVRPVGAVGDGRSSKPGSGNGSPDLRADTHVEQLLRTLNLNSPEPQPEVTFDLDVGAVSRSSPTSTSTSSGTGTGNGSRSSGRSRPAPPQLDLSFATSANSISASTHSTSSISASANTSSNTSSQLTDDSGSVPSLTSRSSASASYPQSPGSDYSPLSLSSALLTPLDSPSVLSSPHSYSQGLHSPSSHGHLSSLHGSPLHSPGLPLSGFYNKERAQQQYSVQAYDYLLESPGRAPRTLGLPLGLSSPVSPQHQQLPPLRSTPGSGSASSRFLPLPPTPPSTLSALPPHLGVHGSPLGLGMGGSALFADGPGPVSNNTITGNDGTYYRLSSSSNANANPNSLGGDWIRPDDSLGLGLGLGFVQQSQQQQQTPVHGATLYRTGAGAGGAFGVPAFAEEQQQQQLRGGLVYEQQQVQQLHQLHQQQQHQHHQQQLQHIQQQETLGLGAGFSGKGWELEAGGLGVASGAPVGGSGHLSSRTTGTATGATSGEVSGRSGRGHGSNEPINFLSLLHPASSPPYASFVSRIIKSADQQASIFLQQKLKVAGPEERGRIVDAICSRGGEMMMHRFGNWAVQRCLEAATGPEERRKIVACMRGRVVDLATNCYGCHVLQKALDCEEEEVRLLIVSELLMGDPAQTLVNKHASHVWSKIMELSWTPPAPPIFAYVNKSLKGKWAALACHETGSLVVQHAFENLEESAKDGIVEELLGQGGVVFAEVAKNQWGAYCVQHILEHGSDKHRHMALDHLLNGLLEFATNEQGNKSVVKALKEGGRETLDRVVQRMCEPAKGARRAMIVDLALSLTGSQLIASVLPNADKDQRAMLYDCIRSHIVTLRGCKTGSKVIWLFDRMRAYYGY